MKALPETIIKVSSTERLVTTLFFAILLHGIVILGITFTGERHDPNHGNTLEVTLVNTRDALPPDKADYLADANQQGEGNTRENVRPEAALNSGDDFALDGIPDAANIENQLAPTDGAQKPDTLAAPPKRSEVDHQVVTSAQSDFSAPSDPTSPQQTNTRQVMVARLMMPDNAMTDPINDANRDPQAHSNNPREKFIAVNTKESLYARYLESWRRKVEKVGNNNFPDEVRRKGLSGTLQLEVSLNADGTIRDLAIRQHSPLPVLDESAVRIVRLAAPFPEFSPEMRAQTDVLRFVYEWKFEHGRSGTAVSGGG